MNLFLPALAVALPVRLSTNSKDAGNCGNCPSVSSWLAVSCRLYVISEAMLSRRELESPASGSWARLTST